MSSKKADLAGPGIGKYEDLINVLPKDYNSMLDPKETQQAITQIKRFIEDGLCKELNLIRVEVPLIVDVESGFNDYLDRDGSRTPVQFHISNDYGNVRMIYTTYAYCMTCKSAITMADYYCNDGECESCFQDKEDAE